jgi:hypothetical protein
MLLVEIENELQHSAVCFVYDFRIIIHTLISDYIYIYTHTHTHTVYGIQWKSSHKI